MAPSTTELKEKLKDALPSKDDLPTTKDELKEEAVKATKTTLSGLRSLTGGAAGGVCAVLVGHPFDLVKVRLQTAESGVYKGAIDVVTKTIAREGLVRGLYAGVSAPLVGVTPMCMSPFLYLSMGKQLTLP